MLRPLPLLLCALGLCLPACAIPSPTLTLLDDDAEPSCDVDFSLQANGAGGAHIEFDRQDDGNFYALDAAPRAARFSVVTNGHARPLSATPVAWKSVSRVTLQRRPFGMNLLVDGAVVLRAFDATWTNGKIGIRTTGAWKVNEPRLQPVEPVHFDDDFTRAGDGGDLGWDKLSGTWSLSAASKKVSARNADMSANPFAFASDASPSWSVASAGRPFWNDYDARVAVRPEEGASIGIAADLLDASNYLAFRLSPNTNGGQGKRELVLVRGGKTTVLASAVSGFVPRQWVQIGLRTSPGNVEGLLDGAPVLRAPTSALGQGKIALLSKDAPALWDDVHVRSYDFLRAAFTSGGAWSGEGWALAGASASANTRGATLLTGRPDWDNYRTLLSTPWTATSSGAVVAGWRDAKNYALIRWAGIGASVPFKGKIQAVRVQNGTEHVEASAPFGAPAASKRLSVSVAGGAFSLGSSGRALVAMPLATAGQFGLRAVGGEARFSDAVIYFPPAPDPPKVASRFAGDGFMLGWASSVGEWPATPDKDGLQFWNTAELFGAWSLDCPWRSNWRGTVEWALWARRDDFKSGLVLRGEVSGDGTLVTWTLARGGKPLASAQSKVADLVAHDDGNTALSLHWSDGLLTLRGGGKVLFSVPLIPPDDQALGYRSDGFRLQTSELNLWSANRDDFTFSDAPIDFYAPSGKWSVFSRWPCYGDWSFFGGTGRQPRLWTKRTYGGDVVAQYYAHPQMDLPKEPGYSHPGDLNVTLCGDGQNPASGYSFLVAGHDNTRTQIRRDGQLVAENTSDGAWFHDVINRNPNWHRTWVYVRASAKGAVRNGQSGVLVSLLVNQEPMCEYFDPHPVAGWKDGGRVCLWTLNSTIMIARAKIEAERMGGLSTPPTLRDTAPRAAAPNQSGTESLTGVDNDETSTLTTPAKEGWRVENQIAGGLFASTTAMNQALTPTSRLSFDWRASKDTHVDAYIRVGDDWHLMEMSPPQLPDAQYPSLGKMTRGTPHDGWTPMSFDLGAALPRGARVDEVRIGALDGDPYRWQGFDGNPQGAWYEVRNLVLK